MEWTARAVGLLSLLTVTPAWRYVDPLPVFGRGPEEEESGVSDDDNDSSDDEHRARWVLLDERAADAA